MAYKKGESGNPAGKPTGAKGKKTLAWEQLGDFFTDAGAKRALSIMMKSDDESFMEHYKNLIELFRPKLARSDIKLTTPKGTIMVFTKDEATKKDVELMK